MAGHASSRDADGVNSGGRGRGATGGWTHHLPTRLLAGRGVRSRLPELLGDGRWLTVTSSSGRARCEADPELGPVLNAATVEWYDRVLPNPTAGELEAAARGIRERPTRPTGVLAVGGGSVIDAAKAIVALLAVPGTTVDELARQATPLARERVLPLVAVPTTAGSGSEATAWAVVWRRRPGTLVPGAEAPTAAKVTLADAALAPLVALVDPALTDGAPAEVARASGLDALVQAAETVWNRNATPVTLALATRAFAHAYEALPRVLAERDDLGARDRLMEASLLAGIAIGQTRSALCHAMSYALTDRFAVPHGVACAFTAAEVARHVADGGDGRPRELAAAVLGRCDSSSDLVHVLAELMSRLGVAAEVRARVGSLERLLALAPEMAIPPRGGTSTVDADERAVLAILRRSWAAA